MTATLGGFARDHRPGEPKASARATAGVLTALLYGCFALLLGQRAFWAMPDHAAPTETMLRLLPDAPRTMRLPPQPVIAHLLRPRAGTPALPRFTIASDAPAAQAQLPITAVKSSPLDAGIPTGTGTGAQIASGNGTGGNGGGLSSCLDADWMQAVTNRVRRFGYYPGAAHAQHATGVVMVHLIVRRDGLLDMLEIGKSSGDWALDEAAFDMVHKALPLPAIPDRMHTDKVEAMLPISFGVAGPFQTSIGNCGG